MDAAASQPLPPLDPAERQALHEAYLSAKNLHHIPFHEAIADRALRICLKNLADIAQRKRNKSDGEPPQLELLP
jgi:hypothetical protein